MNKAYRHIKSSVHVTLSTPMGKLAFAPAQALLVGVRRFCTGQTDHNYQLSEGSFLMKKATIIKLLVCVFLIAAILYAFRSKSVGSFLKNESISIAAIHYNTTETPPLNESACPQIEAGQPEMEALQGFLQTVSVRGCGFTPDGAGMDVPGYDLYFYDENAMPAVKMYITHTGYLYCKPWVYRITAPSAEDAWEQLGSIYESAVSLQN